MPAMNKVFLMGNLARDPELRRSPSGRAVAQLVVALKDGHKDKDGKWIEQTLYVDVVAWEPHAEPVANHLSKGSPVLVEGRLQLDEWTSKSGEKRSKLRVRADRVEFMRSARHDSPDPVS